MPVPRLAYPIKRSMAACLLGAGTLLAFSFAASQPGDALATVPANQLNQIKNGDRSLGAAPTLMSKHHKKRGRRDDRKKSGGRDRVGSDFRRTDKDGDDKLSRAEWHRRGNFARLDTDEDGYLSLGEVRVMYAGHDEKSYDWSPEGMSETEPVMDPSAAKDLVDSDVIKHSILCGIARGRECNPKDPVDHGLFATGLGPEFPENAVCPGIDDFYAYDYSFKRNREIISSA